jgi:hypothetical protein
MKEWNTPSNVRIVKAGSARIVKEQRKRLGKKFAQNVGGNCISP